MERSIRPPTGSPPSAHITLTEFSQWREALIIIIIITTTTLLLHPAVRLGLVGKSWRLERSGMNNTITRWVLSKSKKKEEGGGGEVIKSISGAHQTNLSRPAKVAELSLE